MKYYLEFDWIREILPFCLVKEEWDEIMNPNNGTIGLSIFAFLFFCGVLLLHLIVVGFAFPFLFIMSIEKKTPCYKCGEVLVKSAFCKKCLGAVPTIKVSAKIGGKTK